MGKERQNKFDSEWREGLWLGHARTSNEHILGTEEGVVRAYAIKRQDPERRWSAELVRGLQGTPQQPNPNRPGPAIPIRVNFDTPLADVPEPTAVPDSSRRRIRRMRITQEVLSRYGFTEGCEGCRYKQAVFTESRNHSEACRTRLSEAMDGDARGR